MNWLPEFMTDTLQARILLGAYAVLAVFGLYFAITFYASDPRPPPLGMFVGLVLFGLVLLTIPLVAGTYNMHCLVNGDCNTWAWVVLALGIMGPFGALQMNMRAGRPISPFKAIPKSPVKAA